MKHVDRLTVFTFLWACQALLHQEFYNAWIVNENVAGWLLTVFAVIALLVPRSRVALCLMLVTSIIYNVAKWPFVVNHILVESLFNIAILSALAMTLWERTTFKADRVIDRIAPVLKVCLITMYYFAVLAKLNYGFFDLEQSCVVFMFDDLRNRFPFIPETYLTKQMAIWGTIVIELAIPILLTMKRTQWIAILIGLGFHFMLGLIGHRTFAGLAYAAYALFLLQPLTVETNRFLTWMREKFDVVAMQRIRCAFTILVPLVVLAIVVANYTGNYDRGIGPFKAFRIPWIIWIGWSALVSAVYLHVIRTMNREPKNGVSEKVVPNGTRPIAVNPGWLWLFVGLVALNGSAQYLGFKTETSFTMYANLRTEGGMNNHLFIPTIRLANYQDDLVEILSTDNPGLRLDYLDRDLYITAFEFQRFLSHSPNNYYVAFKRGGKEFQIDRRNPDRDSHPLESEQNLLLQKLLYFRPVPKSEHCPCQH